ncbi:MAG: alkaline phosphatase family protein, partial [Candidatus Heimdallarchaeota archaeon]
MEKRVIIIGLDGMPWHILELLIDRGVMPNLKNVVKKGARGTLKSTIPPYTSASWTSISTGVNPGKHGIFDFQSFRNQSYERTLVNSLNIM